MAYRIRRAAVIGSGTMGSTIAALCANAGIPVDLLDIAPGELTSDEQANGLPLSDPQVRNRIVEGNWKKLLTAHPPALYTDEQSRLVRLGNLDDHFERLAEADWICEAIVERLDLKQAMMARIDEVRKPQAIVSTNTSGISIRTIAEGRSLPFREHFLGLHFFNPPRYLKLLELVPHPDTLPEVVETMHKLAERELGKGIVICKDTPNFIGNRLFSMMTAYELAFALDNGYTVEEVDALAGPLIGRPRTAVFRLLDLVGLDVMASINRNLYAALPDDPRRSVFAHSGTEQLFEAMLANGWLGNKSRAGFYKLVEENGSKSFWAIDLDKLAHRPPQQVQFESLEYVQQIASVGERIKAMVQAGDRAGAFVCHAIYSLVTYAAHRIPEIADDPITIDNAMCWGFAHELGPFEVWDMLGVAESIPEIEAAGFSVPDWVKDMVQAGYSSFYAYENGEKSGCYEPQARAYVPVETRPRQLNVSRLRSTNPVLEESQNASLIDMGENILLFTWRSKAHTITPDIIDLAFRAIEVLETGFDGMVLGHDGDYFSAGANLDLSAIEKRATETGRTTAQLVGEDLIRRGQQMMLSFRRASKPIVAAPYRLALGGGAELVMAADRVVAHAELNIGLVEVGVGIVPGWGGCKELLRRIVNPVMAIPHADPLPALQQVMEQIRLGKVSGSAAEAMKLGFLLPSDRVIANRDHLLYEARREAIHLAAADYRPAPSYQIYAAGRDVLAALRMHIFLLRESGMASEHDALIADKLAWVLCGGDISVPTWVDEAHILELEREALIELIQHPKSLERLDHMLKTGKRLQN